MMASDEQQLEREKRGKRVQRPCDEGVPRILNLASYLLSRNTCRSRMCVYMHICIYIHIHEHKQNLGKIREKKLRHPQQG